LSITFNLLFEAEQQAVLETGSPLSTQMLRQRTRANTSGSITVAIGAKLPTSVHSVNIAKMKPSG